MLHSLATLISSIGEKDCKGNHEVPTYDGISTFESAQKMNLFEEFKLTVLSKGRHPDKLPGNSPKSCDVR